MQMVWKKNKRSRPLQPCPANLPFQSEPDDETRSSAAKTHPIEESGNSLSHSELLQSEGNSLAEEGKYTAALGKWETALALTPERAVLHEQKAQVLLEIGETWKSLQAATRATELQPSWPEAWVTLSRAQLNFGDPELSVQSAKKALELQPNCKDAQDDMGAAVHLIANKRQLEHTGLKVAQFRYTVGDSENEAFYPPVNPENLSGTSHGPEENPALQHVGKSDMPENCFEEMQEIKLDPTDEDDPKMLEGRLLFLSEKGGSSVELKDEGNTNRNQSCQDQRDIP